MKRVTLDSNVWLSGLFWSAQASRIIDLAQTKKITIYCSKEILLEIAEVLTKEPKFLVRNKQSVQQIIDKIADLSVDIRIITKTKIVESDPDDNKIIDCAINSKSEYLITYDKVLLNIKQYKKVKIIHPSEFLRECKY